MVWTSRLSRALCLLSAIPAVVSIISKDEATSLIRRHLEDGYNEYFEYDLSQFSLRFDRCQYVKMYDDQLAEDEYSDSPLAVKHFIVFRLCPSDQCSTCSETFGQYVTEIDDYLASTVQQQTNSLEYMCANCVEECNDDENYCSECGEICYKYQNMAANGYVNAANYIQCQKLNIEKNDNQENGGDDEDAEDNGEDANDDGQIQLYIGPRCSADGSRVLLGLFNDEDCLDPYYDAEPADLLGGDISYMLLSHTSYNTGKNCLSCKENNADENENGNDNANDQQDADDVNEMCEEIYNKAAKCESKNGIDGFIQVNREENDYENQAETEFMVCNFIDTLLTGSYTETGEINMDVDHLTIYRNVTSVQKAAVTLLTLSIAGLLAGAYFTQKQIDRSYPKVDLARRTDAQFI